MITYIKMKVTPDLSRRIQEIIFANGGSWSSGHTDISDINMKYLYIGVNKTISMGSVLACFNEAREEEILAYDFIASQGQQKWLPRYGEEVYMWDYDKESKKKVLFITYYPNSTFGYISIDGDRYKNCVPIQDKEISFTTTSGKKVEVKISEEEMLKLKSQICEEKSNETTR